MRIKKFLTKGQFNAGGIRKIAKKKIADEASSSLLASKVNECSVMTQWSLPQACKAMEQAFQEWTLPKRIKIDNGLPFVNSKARNNPTLPILWWVGMGIEVIQNTPRRPQENGIVENLQGTTYRWVHPASYDNTQDLQRANDEISRRQREVYRIRRKEDKTRKELYPQLDDCPRPYDRTNFCIEKVHQYLSAYVWHRKVEAGGGIKLFGQYFPVGSKWKGQEVSIILDPAINHWIIALASDGTQLNMIPNTIFTQEKIFHGIGFDNQGGYLYVV
jgi:hypothetical protein